MKLKLTELRSAKVLGPRADLTHNATTLSELIHSSPSSSYSGKSCRVTLKSQYINKNARSWFVTYMVWGNQSYSDPRGHKVRIRFFPEVHTDYHDLDVDVSCTCPAFLYYGAQYRVNQKDALEREQQGGKLQPADLGNYPHHNYVICKHIKAVSERVGGLLEKHLKSLTEDSDYWDEAFNKRQLDLRQPPELEEAV